MVMQPRSSSILCGVLLGTLFFSSIGAGAQPRQSGSAIGAERLKVILTEQPRWTVYWSSLGVAPRPPASAASGIIQFSRRGDKIMGQLSIPVFGQECEFEVVIKDDGFRYPGCARFDKDITYDPDDQEYPFKGTGGSNAYWFRPQ
jgi:hypothetical protein